MNPFEVLKFCPKCGKSDWEVKSQNFRKCRACGYEMFKNPTIGAAALVYDDQGRLMVMRRAKEPGLGTLDVPGGFCEIQERIEDAIAREVLEETNIKIEIDEYLFSIPNDYVYKGVELYPLDFFFKCKITDMSNIKLDLEENSEILFLHPQQINVEEFGLKSIRQALGLILKK